MGTTKLALMKFVDAAREKLDVDSRRRRAARGSTSSSSRRPTRWSSVAAACSITTPSATIRRRRKKNKMKELFENLQEHLEKFTSSNNVGDDGAAGGPDGPHGDRQLPALACIAIRSLSPPSSRSRARRAASTWWSRARRYRAIAVRPAREKVYVPTTLVRPMSSAPGRCSASWPRMARSPGAPVSRIQIYITGAFKLGRRGWAGFLFLARRTSFSQEPGDALRPTSLGSMPRAVC